MTDEIDNLLDGTLDDLEDLPAFVVFPPGAHSCLATLEQKKIGDKPAVELKLKLVEHLELADGAEEPCSPGDESSTLFFLDNEFGRGKLKAVCAVIGESLGTGVLREIIEQTTDMEVAVVTGKKQDKKDKDKYYLEIKEIVVS